MCEVPSLHYKCIATSSALVPDCTQQGPFYHFRPCPSNIPSLPLSWYICFVLKWVDELTKLTRTSLNGQDYWNWSFFSRRSKKWFLTCKFKKCFCLSVTSIMNLWSCEPSTFRHPKVQFVTKHRIKRTWQDETGLELELADRGSIKDKKERRNGQKALSVDNYWRAGI